MSAVYTLSSISVQQFLHTFLSPVFELLLQVRDEQEERKVH